MKKNDAPAKEKKGKKSWTPAQRMKVVGKNPDYVYRWIDATDPDNLRRKQEDGWVPASKLHGDAVENGEKHDTSITETRGLILHALPAEDYQSHREYFSEKTKQQTAGLKKRLLEDAERASPGGSRAIHGTIVIE
jgi:hypothetical protein